MSDDKKISQRRVPKTKRYKRLRNVSALNIALLMFNIFGFFWVSELTVESSKAASVGLCIEICAQGDDGCVAGTSCEDLINPPVPDDDAEEDTSSVVTGDTTVTIPGSIFEIILNETPLGLISDEEIQRHLVQGQVPPPANVLERVTTNTQVVQVIEGQNIILDGNKFVTFWGRANLKNAIIILTLSSPVTMVGTIFAGEFGYWNWTTPQIVITGIHYLNVMAMSPTNTAIRQDFLVGITAKEVEGVIPGVDAPEFGEVDDIFSPTPIEPIDITSDVYVLNLDISSEYEIIYPDSNINLIVDIISFNPQFEEEIEVIFNVRNNLNEIIFEDSQFITISNFVTIIKGLQLTSEVGVGDFVATVEIINDNVSYLSSLGFEVSEKLIVAAPGTFPTLIGRTQVQTGLYVSSVFLTFTLMLFSILLWREYQRSKSDIQIEGGDLLSGGEII